MAGSCSWKEFQAHKKKNFNKPDLFKQKLYFIEIELIVTW
jgi:hypothetical protein